MLQIIVFALILGVILANMGDRVDIVKNFFGQFNDIMMEMTMAVMKLAPIGVFCLIAKTFAEIGFEVFLPLLKYMFCVLLALAVQCFVVYLGLLKIFSGLNPFIFIKNFFPDTGCKFVLVFFSLSLAHLAASTLDGSCPATYTKLNHRVRNETDVSEKDNQAFGTVVEHPVSGSHCRRIHQNRTGFPGRERSLCSKLHRIKECPSFRYSG